jgi:FtsH-binding integral membrane protein
MGINLGDLTNDATNSQTSSTKEKDLPTINPLLQKAGSLTKVFFACLAGLGGIGCFCVGIAFTPFSPEGGVAAFGIGTSLFGLVGVLLFNLSNQAPSLSSRNVSS